MKLSTFALSAVATAAIAVSAIALPTVAAEMAVTVGGAPMYPSKNIIQNAVNSKDHTTLVAAVKAAGLVDTLSAVGPFTVFAPTNEAFAKLPAGTVDMLLKPENKDQLVGVLTYHVVPGRYTTKNIMEMIKKSGGKKARSSPSSRKTALFGSGTQRVTPPRSPSRTSCSRTASSM